MCYLCEDKKKLHKAIVKRDALIKEMSSLLKIILPLAEGEYPVKWCYAKDIRLLLEKAERGFQ